MAEVEAVDLVENGEQVGAGLIDCQRELQKGKRKERGKEMSGIGGGVK